MLSRYATRAKLRTRRNRFSAVNRSRYLASAEPVRSSRMALSVKRSTVVAPIVSTSSHQGHNGSDMVKLLKQARECAGIYAAGGLRQPASGERLLLGKPKFRVTTGHALLVFGKKGTVENAAKHEKALAIPAGRRQTKSTTTSTRRGRYAQDSRLLRMVECRS